jgi:hypothetical protein
MWAPTAGIDPSPCTNILTCITTSLSTRHSLHTQSASPQLEVLVLPSCGITGHLHSSAIGHVKSLHYLDLSGNNIQGTLPDVVASE